MLIWVPVVLAACISLISLKFLPLPYVWILVTWMLVSIYFAGIAVTASRKLVWINVAGVALALLGGEMYIWLSDQDAKRQTTMTTPQDVVQGDVLGYAPKPGVRANAKSYVDGDLVYDVHYTISPEGFRTGPPFRHNGRQACVLFFGGSYMFGSGVNDTETMPYQVQIQSAGRYRTYNMAFRGYGPHIELSSGIHVGGQAAVPQQS